MVEKVIPELWDHQKKAVERARQLENMFIFFDVGVGKSATAITICRQIYANHGEVIPSLILAPSSILRQWKEEFGIFSKIGATKVHAIVDAGKKRSASVASIIEKDPNQIIIINYEALLTKDIYDSLLAWGPKLLILDESHLVKSEKAKRSKLVFELSKKARYKFGMSGTPILKNALDLFMPFKIIDGGKTFGNSFFVFRNKYFIDKNASWSNKPNHFPNFVPNNLMYDELTAKVASISCQARKEDCIDLPDYVEIKRYCTMSPEQQKAYTEMERDFLTYLQDDHSDKPRAAIAQIAVSKSMKLLQIASGFVNDEQGNAYFFKDNSKIALLKELLEELEGKKVIVWCHFKSNHVQVIELLDRMKIKYVQIDGDASIKEKGERQHLFETDPSYLVCLANQGAAGTGLNLKAAGYAIYYSKDYSYGKDEQSAGRNFRGGSILLHEKITRYDLLTENTIDDKVLDIIKNKDDISKIIMDWSKK